ncbi:MAG: flavodoxin family protein [Caldisericota bacterium]|nr:flavodoxin family protein [Caldisericota bacterium]
MKTLIVYVSMHHGNTKKITKAMAEVLNADITKLSEAKANILKHYDLIGFSSGIYYGKYSEELLNFIDRLDNQKGKMAFIFSTSGIGIIPIINDFNKLLKKRLLKKGFKIIGEFNCRGWGWDTYPLIVKPFGGISKGRPNKKDIENAKGFAMHLKTLLFFNNKI